MVDAATTGLMGSLPRSRDVAPSPAPTAARVPGPEPAPTHPTKQAHPPVQSRPTWFGPDERPLFGWWHVPASQHARATVVMVPAAARERLSADHSWRLLAIRLAELGFAVLRFDLSSTGDSAGTCADVDLVERWQVDVRTALSSAGAACAGPVVLIGHRLGAVLATEAVRGAAVQPDAMVLWDPVARGKRYLRELTAQQLMAVPGSGKAADSGYADVPGDDLTAETAHAISRLNLLTGGALPTSRALVLARSGSEATFAPLVAGLPDARVEGVDRQAELLNLDPIDAEHAYDVVERIASWVDEAVPAASTPIDTPGEASARLLVDRSAPDWASASASALPDLVPIVERAGTHCDGTIFTIESFPDRPSPTRTVLLLSAGVEVHTGPGRLWVDLARQWAAHGVRVVRCDMPGLGESPSTSSGGTRPVSETRSVYEAAAIGDVEALVRELDPQHPENVVLVGMCSGAYNGLEASARLGTRQLIALAFGWWLVPAELRRGQRLDRRRKLYRSGLGLLRLPMAFPFGRRLLVEHPERLWLVGSSARLAAPLRPFRRAVAAGTDVSMIMGPSDLRHFTTRSRQLERLRARPGFSVQVVEDLDHGLLSGGPRRLARREILRQVLDHPAPDDR